MTARDPHALLAAAALAYYIDGGGEVTFHDGAGDHPRRDRPFTVSFTVRDPERYQVHWWRLMRRTMGRDGRTTPTAPGTARSPRG